MALGEAMKRLRRHWRADTYTGIAQVSDNEEASQLRQEIFDRVRRYHELVHQPRPFVPFTSRINYAGRFFGADEMVNLADSMLDFWLTLGPYGDLFESKMKKLLGSRDFALVNSGSSANLTAVTALCSPLVDGHLSPGDEVITPAVTFPTTLAPILQNQLVPVFVDCELGTYNVDVSQVEAAISPRTRAMVIPHTLGNPCDLDVLVDIAARHRLFFVEDTCDALGGTFDDKLVGTFGDLATFSFYPAHHITMGEGGGVAVNRHALSRAVKSVRDWGRDCWCAPGESNTCAQRFGWCLGDLPAGYDHKYIYGTIGFNLKPTDMQAAIGVAQLDALPTFVEARRGNFARLYEGLQPYQDRILLPKWNPRAKPSWFGFPITVREGIRRDELVQWLESANIETRLVFAGNILRQPGYRDIPHRLAGSLENSDRVMRDTLFVGVYPGISEPMMDFMLERFSAFFSR
jgi:CDP-6-deoxy-D-xylo-4-hexulose-3-dehydrase